MHSLPATTPLATLKPGAPVAVAVHLGRPSYSSILSRSLGGSFNSKLKKILAENLIATLCYRVEAGGK
jgi:hypothetical protein